MNSKLETLPEDDATAPRTVDAHADESAERTTIVESAGNMNICTRSLEHYELPEGTDCQVTRTIKIPGNGEISDPVPVNWMLLEPFWDDYHFTQYACPAGVRCIKADAAKYDGLKFTFMAFDLDYCGHTIQPNDHEFAELVGVLGPLKPQPNIAYPTRRGARAIFLIKPICNPGEFERRHAYLAKKLDRRLTSEASSYGVDTSCNDWTRLFRCPRVIRDGVAEYERDVRCYHLKELDTDKFKLPAPEQPPPPRPRTAKPMNARDPILLGMLRNDLKIGSRNNQVFSALCYTLRTFESEAAQIWLEAIREKAIAAGLDEQEFESTLRSAYRTVNREVPEL